MSRRCTSKKDWWSWRNGSKGRRPTTWWNKHEKNSTHGAWRYEQFTQFKFERRKRQQETGEIRTQARPGRSHAAAPAQTRRARARRARARQRAEAAAGEGR